MTPEFPRELAQELLDDFYTECDEQLGALRDLLTELENGGGDVKPEAFEPLFRNMHSLKGNAAIVGLREGEQLAHAAEGFLKFLNSGVAKLSEAGVEALVQSVHRLELVISAHRQKKPIPLVADLVDGLEELVEPASDKGPRPITPESTVVVQGGAANDFESYRFIFSPSKELDERGVNVASVRAKLASLGKIVGSQPLIGGGTVRFEFIAELPVTSALADWAADGVTFDKLAPIPVVAQAPSTALTTDDHVAALFIAPSHIVRVDITRLDDLLRIAGELVIHRSHLDDRLNQGITDKSDLKEVNLALTRSLRELREAITRVRLVPVAEVFARLPFVVRDLARGSGKKATLVIEGKHTEIDKYLVERLKEPLLHLVRNAFSHGIEETDERVANGKEAEGTIVLKATAAGGFVLITISDDGRGVDVNQVIKKAKALDLPLPEIIDDKALLDLLCSPGFSTKDEADRAAGRGVGMSVVKDVVRELGGSLSLRSVLSHGTQFTLRLPLTLSIVETVLFTVSGQTCAVPQNIVQEIIEVEEVLIRSIKQTHVIPYRDGVLPVVRLNKMFGSVIALAKVRHVLVIRSDQGFVGLVIDCVIGQREVVVRPMGDTLIQAKGIAGATELGDGRPVLILDAFALLEGAVRPFSAEQRATVSSTA